MYFLSFNVLFKDAEHGESGFRVKTSYGTYTVTVTPRQIIVHPRGEEPTILEMIEPYVAILATPEAIATHAVMAFEHELYGERP